MRSRAANGATSAVVALGSLVLLSGLALAGCSQIPTSGPVRQGDLVAATVDDPFIRVLPHPPAPGLSPEAVVSGFLAATAGFEDDHAVARLYLTSDAAARWDPSTKVTVYPDDPGLDVTAVGHEVEVRTLAEATIDADGLLTPGPGRPLRRDFGLTRIDGEWRIDSLPDGLLLSRSDVARSFRAFDLYFLSPQGDRLVPDPVFIPIDRPGAATSLVRALIDGPTPWLAPAVRSAFPEGTQLLVDAVPVENGVARVDLSADALTASDADRQRMAAQLVWTLTQLTEVTAVTVTVEGSPLELPVGATRQTTATWAAFDPNAPPVLPSGYLVLHGAMAEYTEGRPEPVPGVLGSGEEVVRDPTATSAGDLFAAVSGDGRTLLLQGRYTPDVLTPVVTGTDLAAPSFDGYDRLWSVDRTADGSTVQVRLPEGRSPRVVAPALDGVRVVALRLAADGTRAAVVVERHDRTGQLFLARVAPVEGGFTLDGLRRVERQLVDVRDVAWSASDSLVVLGRQAGSALQPFTVTIDGTLTQAGGSLMGIVAVAAAPGRPLLAGTADGRVWQDSGLGWRTLSRGSDPAYSG